MSHLGVIWILGVFDHYLISIVMISLNCLRNCLPFVFGFLFLFSSTPNLHGQAAITVNYLGNNNYKIGTTTLNPEDLVFYRFSDGYEMTNMAIAANSQAPVERKFRSNQVKVTAYIARKSGPIGIATGDIGNSNCSSCPVPAVGLVNGEFVRLRPSSWDPFIDPAVPASLSDNKTTPTFFNTPTQPWFLLPVTLKGPGLGAYSNISIPPGMTIKGALIKGIWKELFIQPNEQNLVEPDVKGFVYSNPTNIRINLNSINNEFNVYLVVTSATVLGQQSVFSAQMFNSNGTPNGAPSQQILTTHQNPHDPNELTAFQDGTCHKVSSVEPLQYRVDFQNLGLGRADTVKVSVKLDQRIFDMQSLTSDLIHSSHALTSYSIQGDSVVFTFNNIYLAGMGQTPTPAVASTKGWVSFSMLTNSCIQAETGYFLTSAKVTFMVPGFMETMETNNTRQYLWDCGVDPLCLMDGRNAAPEVQAPFEPKCYPTLFSDNLLVEVPAAAENGALSVTLRDLTGKACIARNYQTIAGDATREMFETTSLPAGLYLVHISNGKDNAVIKVIKN